MHVLWPWYIYYVPQVSFSLGVRAGGLGAKPPRTAGRFGGPQAPLMERHGTEGRGGLRDVTDVSSLALKRQSLSDVWTQTRN